MRPGAHLRQGALELELLEGARNDVLLIVPRVCHTPQQIQQRVVCQAEAGVERAGLARHYCPAGTLGLTLLQQLMLALHRELSEI